MTVQLPAATSWCSLMARETNAKTTAARNDATETAYSICRDLNTIKNSLKRGN